MAKVSESTGKTQLNSELKAGLDTLSLSQTITFNLYNRFVLPVDGYIFWIKDQVAAPVKVKGSFHYSTRLEQSADEYLGRNTVIFTAQSEIQFFNNIAPNQIYIASLTVGTAPNTRTLKFAFGERAPLYLQAGLYHYTGEAIYPAMFPQVLDSPALLSTLPVLSNSMPIWLALAAVMPIYPAHLVPQNSIPPYASIEISDTVPLASAPYLDYTSNHNQLVKDIVEITIYGVRNNDALDFQDYVFQQSLNTETFGIMNIPIIKDRKRVQKEIGTIAIKKSMDFEINYYQSRAQAIARQLITSATCPVTIENYGILDANFILNQSVLAPP